MLSWSLDATIFPLIAFRESRWPVNRDPWKGTAPMCDAGHVGSGGKPRQHRAGRALLLVSGIGIDLC